MEGLPRSHASKVSLPHSPRSAHLISQVLTGQCQTMTCRARLAATTCLHRTTSLSLLCAIARMIPHPHPTRRLGQSMRISARRRRTLVTMTRPKSGYVWGCGSRLTCEGSYCVLAMLPSIMQADLSTADGYQEWDRDLLVAHQRSDAVRTTGKSDWDQYRWR
jgi:hypothetical protein